MQEWYRARDVYYEIAKIFPFTDWSETAVRRLRFIMNGGLTREKEKVEVETVFFGLNEDMNKNVQTLFDDLASGKRMVFAQEEETGSKQQPAAEEEDKLNLDEPDQ
jgi:hypothetical protein